MQRKVFKFNSMEIEQFCIYELNFVVFILIW